MEQRLRAFGAHVGDLIGGKSLTREEANEMFRQVLMDQQPDLQQGAFLAAITAKGPTPDEIAGSWEAIYDLDTMKVTPRVDGFMAENSGTGMDSLKTFNISTAAAVVAAADGVVMTKHGARAITSRCGAVDIAEAVGVDVECDVSVVRRSIEVAGIGIFNGMSPKVHPTALFRILSQVRFGTILHIAGSLANPARPQLGLRGVYSKAMVVPTIEAMRAIGFRRATVVHGSNADGTRGMDELSTLGPTEIAELYPDGSITTYTVTPQSLGLAVADERDVVAGHDREAEVLRFLRVLSGVPGPEQDIVCLNAAPLMVMSGRASDLAEGIERARRVIEQGRALDRLRQWARAQNSDPSMAAERLDGLVGKACSEA